MASSQAGNGSTGSGSNNSNSNSSGSAGSLPAQHSSGESRRPASAVHTVDVNSADLLRNCFFAFDDYVLRDERAKTEDLLLMFYPENVSVTTRSFLLGGVSAMLNLSKAFTGEEAAGKRAVEALEREAAQAQRADEHAPELPVDVVMDAIRDASRSAKYGSEMSAEYCGVPRVLALGKAKLAVVEVDCGVVLCLGGEAEGTDSALVTQLRTLYGCFCLLFGSFRRLLRDPDISGNRDEMSSDQRRELRGIARRIVLRRFQFVFRELLPLVQRVCHVHRETRFSPRAFPQLLAHTELPLGATRYFVQASQILEVLANSFASPSQEEGIGYLGGVVFFDSTVLCSQLRVLPVACSLTRVEFLRANHGPQKSSLANSATSSSEARSTENWLNEESLAPFQATYMRMTHDEAIACGNGDDRETPTPTDTRAPRRLHAALDNGWSPVADPQCSVLFRERRRVYVTWNEKDASSPVLSENPDALEQEEPMSFRDSRPRRRAYCHVIGLANLSLVFFVDATIEDSFLRDRDDDPPFVRVLSYCQRQLEQLQQDMTDRFGAGAVLAGGATHKLVNSVRVPLYLEEGTASFYHYLCYDSQSATAHGSSMAPVNSRFASHVGAARETLADRKDCDQVLLRDHASGVYCRRKFGREVYFQPRNANSHKLFIAHIEKTAQKSLQEDYDVDLT